jgi:hypothetical protein
MRFILFSDKKVVAQIEKKRKTVWQISLTYEYVDGIALENYLSCFCTISLGFLGTNSKGKNT